MTAKAFIKNTEDSDYIAVAALSRGQNGIQGIPLCGWGDPGSGKSSLIPATLQKIGFKVVAMDLCDNEPSDLTGIPRVSDKPYAEFKMNPYIWEAYNGGQRGYALLLDEATDAAPAIQAAARRLILTRQCAGYNLSHVPVFLTANPNDVAQYELLPSFANRMLHFRMKEDNAHRYEDGEDLAPKIDRSRVEARWEQCREAARAATHQFRRRARGEFVTQRPKQNYDSPEEYAFPTGRSWSYAAAVIAGCMAAGISEKPLLQAAVGEASASAYVAYTAQLDLPSPEEIFSGQVNWKLLASNPDRVYTAALTAARTAQTGSDLRVLLSAAMTLRTEAKIADLMGPAMRIVRDRTSDRQDILAGVLTEEISDEILDTQKALGLVAGA